MMGFGERLFEAVRTKRTPTMVGIDPRWASLPAELKKGRTAPATCDDLAQDYFDFCDAILDVVADLVGVVKFQSAFFEAAGPPGVNVLWRLAHRARKSGLVVIMDAKRGDIGSTAEAYAEAYLSPIPGASSPIADALTVNPFLGRETLDPFLQQASLHAGGVFVLVRTSNPGSADLQLVTTGEQQSPERTISDRVAGWVEESSSQSAGPMGYGDVGAVVGATHARELGAFRRLMPHAPLLLPGYGAQGGTAADLAEAFDARGLGAVVNNSRGIIFAYQSEKEARASWRDAVRAATERMVADLADHTPAGNLRS